MELPTTRIKPKIQDPKLLILFGQSKVGKTTKLAELDNCLIIDTEKGTDYIEGMKVQVSSLSELSQVLKAVNESQYKYSYGVLDVIDKAVEWIEEDVVAQYNKEQKLRGLKVVIKDISEIPYGGGFGMVRARTMKLIAALKNVFDRVIIVGHRKKTIIGETSVEFTASSLDLTGKLKNLVCADADAIGYVFRDDKGVLKVSFQGSDELEVGSRSPHLRGQVLEFEWEKIYVDKN
jgi:hypothetical protein